jgi:hypothetical protein
MPRKELPVVNSMVVAFSDNSKLGGMACTYRPVGTPSHGGSCPHDCQFLPEHLGGTCTDASIMCYALTGWCRKHQRTSAGRYDSLYRIGRGVDVRLHVSGDFLLPELGGWDWEYSTAIADFARQQFGCVYAYSHVLSLSEWGTGKELVQAGVVLWASRDSVPAVLAELRALRALPASDAYAVGCTLAQPLDILKESKRAIESAGYTAMYCPWDLSRALTGQNPAGVISCRDCRLCLDSPKRPDVILFPVHGTGAEGGL